MPLDEMLWMRDWGGRRRTIDAAETRALFAKDAELSDDYNHKLLNGRWDHMMDQTHIGYTNWQEPPLNAMPAVTEVQVPVAGLLSVADRARHAVPSIAGHIRFGGAADTDSEVVQPRQNTSCLHRSPPARHGLWSPARAAAWSSEDDFEVHMDWKTAPSRTRTGTVTVTPQRGIAAQVELESFGYPA